MAKSTPKGKLREWYETAEGIMRAASEQLRAVGCPDHVIAQSHRAEATRVLQESEGKR